MLLAFLTIVSVWTMLTHIVLLDEERVHRQVGIDAEGHKGHLGALLHHLGVVHSVVRRRSP